MKERGKQLVSDALGATFFSVFKSPVCLVKGHDWQKETYWDLLERGCVTCLRCGASQFLDEVQNEEEMLLYKGKRFGIATQLSLISYCVLFVFILLIAGIAL